MCGLTTKGPEYRRSFFALLVQRLGEEALAAKLVRNAVDGRSGLHPQRREALAPATLVISVIIAICEMRIWRRAVLLVLKLRLLLLLSFCWGLIR